MARKVFHSIHDIVETIDRVQGKVAGCSFPEFEADWEMRFIVERAIEIISEATRRIPVDSRQPDPKSAGAASQGSAVSFGTSITPFQAR
jgi:uncharacterized protein with HEPN domain